MNYRDWAGADPSPQESRPSGPWDDGDASPDPEDHHHSRPVRAYRTPSRRRAVQRGQEVSADQYLPGWAVEAGRTIRTDRTGRPRHDLTGEGWETDRPTPGYRTTETTNSWQRVTETTSWGGSPKPGSPSSHPQPHAEIGPDRHADHTTEWRIDHLDDDGYVGSRRARTGSHAGHHHVVDPAIPVRGGATGRPAIEAWNAVPATEAWNAVPATDWRDRTSGTDQWDGLADSGQWDGLPVSGQWDGFAVRQDRSAGSGDRAGHGGHWSDRTETSFWSGTRLAGDDPRWMATPASAPRSPAVTGLSAPPGQPAAPGRRRADPSCRRQAPEGTSRSGSRRIQEDLLDDDRVGGPLASVLYAVACYAVPVVLLFAWLLTLDGRVPAGCVTDVTGGGCDSPRAYAVDSLLGGADRFGLALAASMLVALALRWVSRGWRAASVGLAGAVVGGGLSTLLHSAISGQPLG